MRRRLVRQAYPSLRGLVSDQIGRGPTLCPWPNVSPCPRSGGGSFVCLDRDGRPLTEDGRTVHLHVPGVRERALAARAWRRCIRQAWQREDTLLQETYSTERRPWRSVLLVSLIFLVLAVTTTGLLANRLWVEGADTSLREDLEWIETTFAMGILVMGCLLVVVFGYTAWRAACLLTRPLAAQVRFDASGVQAHLADGSETSGRWAELGSIHFKLHRIRFRSGTVLWLPPLQTSARIRYLLQLVEERFCPQAAARRTKSGLGRVVFWSTVCLALAGGTGFFVDHLNAQGITPATGLGAALLVVGCGAVAALMAFHPRLERWIATRWDRWRKRRRRAGRMGT